MSDVKAIKAAEYVKSAVKSSQYPPDLSADIAFAGRSNVGKSSLINCLTQRRKLVRTSRTPGQTQTINFFRINDAFYFVDLPGYGFARVPLDVRARWGPMVETYLTKRKSLRGIVQIIDSRRPPTPDDMKLWNWLRDRSIPAIAVLTKADKIARGKWESTVNQASLSLGLPVDRLILFSAVTQLGREVLLEKLGEWIDAAGAGLSTSLE